MKKKAAKWKSYTPSIIGVPAGEKPQIPKARYKVEGKTVNIRVESTANGGTPINKSGPKLKSGPPEKTKHGLVFRVE